MSGTRRFGRFPRRLRAVVSSASAAAMLIALATGCASGDDTAGSGGSAASGGSAGSGSGGGSTRCAVVVDVSASVPAELRPRYIEDATAALDSCVGGHVHVDVADANARAGRCPPVDVTLVAPRPRDNPLFDEAAQRKQLDLAVTGTEELVACATEQPADATDLFGAFVLAGASLHAEPAGRRELTVLTDGISTGAPYDLSARELDDADIEALLDALAADRLVADLAGVEARIVGAGVGVDGMDPVRLGRVEAAWRAYVARAGGTVTLYAKTLGGTP